MATGKQPVKIRRQAAPQEVLYTGYTTRNTDLYPLTPAGEAAFEAAASAGAFTLTVPDPSTGTLYTIPAGTRPPLQPPYPTGGGSGTATASTIGLASRYTYSTGNGGSLQIRASGLGAFQMKVERVDGQPLTLSNAQNPSLSGGVFYGPGTVEATDGYTLDWTFWGVGSVPVRITFQKNGIPESKVITPAATTNPVQLFTTSVTNPPPTTTTYRSFNRMLVVGNSYTKAGQVPGTDWFPKNANGQEEPRGMAAMSLLADYVHKIWTELKTVSPNLKFRAMGDYASFERCQANQPGCYLNAFNYDGFYTGIGHEQDGVLFGYDPVDLLIISGGENFDDGQFNYAVFAQEMDKLIAKVPKTSNCVIMFRNSTWSGNNNSNAGQRQYAESKGYEFINLDDIRDKPEYQNTAFSNPFIAKHWNDAGHAEIARRFLEKLKTTTTTPPVGSGNVDADGFLVYDDQGWIGADEKQIENDQVIMKFKKSVGGCPTWAALKSNGRSVINDQQMTKNGVRMSDKGVQWMVSLYANPKRIFTINGVTITGMGANPVPGGSMHHEPGLVLKSAVINDPQRGQVYCVRHRGLFWNWVNEPGNITVDVEWWLVGKRICYKSRIIVEQRASYIPEQREFIGQEQEKQSLYNIASFNRHLTKIGGGEYNMRQESGPAQPGLENFSATFLTDECWAGTYNSDLSQGVTYFTPQNSAFKSWQKFGEAGEWDSDYSAYLVACPENNLDDVGAKLLDYGYMILGSKADAMAEIAGLGGADQRFDFVFGGTNIVDPQWFSKDGKMIKDGNDYIFEIGTPNRDNNAYNTARLNSPHRAWQASGITQLQFTMAVYGNGGNQDIKFIFAKPGKKGDPAREFYKWVTVQADGVERTYTVTPGGGNFRSIDGSWNENGDWSGIINHVAIGGKDGMPFNTKIKLKRIRKP